MKEEPKLITIQAPVGGLIIPPNRIKSVFKKMFKAGMKNQELHPDDDTYDNITFYDTLKKILESFPKERE